MGVYELQDEEVDEFPLYKKADESHYIYRGKTGSWMVTGTRKGVDVGLSGIRSSAKERLLTHCTDWKFYDGKKYVPDAKMSVNMEGCV